jgi:hypothetical protein
MNVCLWSGKLGFESLSRNPRPRAGFKNSEAHARGAGTDTRPTNPATHRSDRRADVDSSARRIDRWIGRILLAQILALIIGLLIAPAPQAHASASVTGCRSLTKPIERRACIIRRVFGDEGRTAVRVAWCESRLDPNARNGQYLGTFQMGERERARFGHGRTTLAQARAAKRYHDVAGWQPWSCA